MTSRETPIKNQPDKEKSGSSKYDRYFDTNRINTLSDGVFAIVMTLLILGLKIKQPSGPITSLLLSKELLIVLGKLEGYIATFLILGIFWMDHHEQFHHIKRVNKKLLWINILFLIFVSMVPFFAGLQEHFEKFSISTALFGVNMLIIMATLYFNWKIAIKDNLVDTSSLTPHLQKKITNDAYYGMFFIFAAIVAAFINVHLSFALDLGIFIMLWVKDRKAKKVSEQQASDKTEQS